MKWQEVTEEGWYWVVGDKYENEPYITEIELDINGELVYWVRHMDYGDPIDFLKDAELTKIEAP